MNECDGLCKTCHKLSVGVMNWIDHGYREKGNKEQHSEYKAVIVSSYIYICY